MIENIPWNNPTEERSSVIPILQDIQNDHGKIEVESELNKGTKFTLLFQHK